MTKSNIDNHTNYQSSKTALVKTRVDFAFNAEHRLTAACQSLQKHYMVGNQVIVYTQDLKRLEHFNNLLWGFQSTAFIPHCYCHDEMAQNSPIILSHLTPSLLLNKLQKPWLLNLDMNCPPEAEKFERILEIVSNHTEDKSAARQRWKQYAEMKFDVRAHDLQQNNLA